MNKQHTLSAIAAIGLTFAGQAAAEDHSLSTQDLMAVAVACERGTRLLPVSTDVQRAADQFALPIRDPAGASQTAIIVDRSLLERIPSCATAMTEWRMTADSESQETDDEA